MYARPLVFEMLLRCWESKFCEFGVFLLFPRLGPALSSLPYRQRLDGQGGADWGSYSKSPPAPVLESPFICCRLLLLPPFSANPTSLTLCLSISPTSSLLQKEKEKKKIPLEEAWLCVMNIKRKGSLVFVFAAIQYNWARDLK